MPSCLGTELLSTLDLTRILMTMMSIMRYYESNLDPLHRRGYLDNIRRYLLAG